MEAGRSEEIRHIGDGSFCGSHNYAAGEVDLCVHIKVNNLTYRGSPIHLQHYRALVLTGRRIRLVTLPVQRVDADGTRQNNFVIGILLYVLGTLGAIADDDTCIALSLGELQVRILLEIVFRDGETNGIGSYHALVVVLVLLEVVLQHVFKQGRTLTMSRNDEWTTVIAFLKEISTDMGKRFAENPHRF